MRYPKWEAMKKLLDDSFVPISGTRGKTVRGVYTYSDKFFAIGWTDGTCTVVDRQYGYGDDDVGLCQRTLMPGEGAAIVQIGLMSREDWEAASTEGVRMVEEQQRAADLEQYRKLRAIFAGE